MSKSTLAGAAALLAAPPFAIVAALVQPTLSDAAADQVRALTDHRSAAIAGLGLETASLVLVLAGAVWLAFALAPSAPRLALAGGVLGVLGSLVVLFEDGVAAASPAVVEGLDPVRAVAVLDRVQSSAAVTVLGPFSLLFDAGLALLGVAAVKAGAARWVAAAIAVGAFGEGTGFATGTRALVVAAFIVLLTGLVGAVRVLVAGPAGRVSRGVVPA